jgi:nitrate/nitrite-specific signal transduction histidine kinase
MQATRRQITAIDNASKKIRANLEQLQQGIEDAVEEIRELLGDEDESRESGDAEATNE